MLRLTSSLPCLLSQVCHSAVPDHTPQKLLNLNFMTLKFYKGLTQHFFSSQLGNMIGTTLL